MEVLPWSRHHRVFPGEGSFDLPAFVAHLLRTGYDGPLSLEIFNDVFREAEPFATAVDGMRSLVWLQQRTRGALASAGLRPRARSSLLRMASTWPPASSTRPKVAMTRWRGLPCSSRKASTSWA